LSEGELNIFSILKKMLDIDTAEGFMTIKNEKGFYENICRAIRR
jgi:hypothetical protein